MARIQRLLGGIAYAVFLLVVVEVALQGFYYATAGDFLFSRVGLPIYAPDEWSGIANRPNLAYEHRASEFRAMYYTNDQGFRIPRDGGNYPMTPPPDTTRILLLGPSFAYGWGVDYKNSLAHELEAILDTQNKNRGVEIINAGVPSIGLAPQLNWFVHKGHEFQPDLVIQLVYGSLIVKDRIDTGQRVDEDGYLVREDASFGERMRAQLKKFATVFYGWIVYTRLDQTLSESNDSDEILGAGRELRQHHGFDPAAPPVQEALDVYRRLRDEVDAAGADLAIVFFPLSYAIHPEDASRWRHLGIRDIGAQRAFNDAFCRHLVDSEGIRCINISDDLSQAAEKTDERLYYWLDVHWTPLGNRVAARALADHLPMSQIMAPPTKPRASR